MRTIAILSSVALLALGGCTDAATKAEIATISANVAELKKDQAGFRADVDRELQTVNKWLNPISSAVQDTAYKTPKAGLQVQGAMCLPDGCQSANAAKRFCETVGYKDGVGVNQSSVVCFDRK